MPHIIWQFQNNYPTLKFHLFDKESTFKAQNIISYISEQLGVTGPIFLLLFSILFKCKTLFQKALKFNVIGVFAFFLFSSFKENVNLHWTAVAWPPMICLAYLYIIELNIRKLNFIKGILIFNLTIVILLRINFLFNWIQIPHFNDRNPKLMSKILNTKAKSNLIVFKDMYLEPSFLAFYENKKCFAVNDIGYKKTQFNYLDKLEKDFQNKTVSLISNDSIDATSKAVKIIKGKTYYFTEIHHFSSFSTTIRIEAVNFKILKSDSKYKIPFKIISRLNNKQIENFHRKNYNLILTMENLESKIRNTYKYDGKLSFLNTNSFNFRTPLIKGKYKCVFSIIIDNQKFTGFNSDIYHIEIF